MVVNDTMAVLVVVFGNRAYDDTLLELKNEASAVSAAIAAVAEHSIMRKYGKGRPDSQDEMELRQFSKKITELITNKKSEMDFVVPGNSQYRKYNGVPFKPKADKACTKCGVCAEKCPVQAIPQNNPASLDKKSAFSVCVVFPSVHKTAENSIRLFYLSPRR